MPHPKSYPLSGSTPTDLHLIPSTHRTHDAKWDAARFSKVWTCSTLKTTKLNCKYIPRPKAKNSSDRCFHSRAQIFIYRHFRRNFRMNVSSGTIFLNRWSRDKCRSANVWWVTLPIQSNPDTASPSLRALKVCQQKIPITQCFGLLQTSIYCHKPWWVNNNVISGFDWTLQNSKNRCFTMHGFFNFQFSSQHKIHNDFFPSLSRCFRWRKH